MLLLLGLTFSSTRIIVGGLPHFVLRRIVMDMSGLFMPYSVGGSYGQLLKLKTYFDAVHQQCSDMSLFIISIPKSTQRVCFQNSRTVFLWIMHISSPNFESLNCQILTLSELIMMRFCDGKCLRILLDKELGLQF